MKELKKIKFSSKEDSQKGISIVFSILISSLLLGLSLGISAILISQIKMIQGMGNSVVAFYAADTGIEAMLHDLYKNYGGIGDFSGNVGDASYIGSISTSSSDPECSAINFCIKSIGSYEKVKRAIQANY